MPVTAKLSKLFYDRLGDQIADELVNWFNAVDDTYRANLRELNELNFARFDAKLEQRLAEVEARLDAKIDGVATRLDAKIDGVATRLDAKIDRIAAQIETKLDRLEAQQMFAKLDAKIERRFADLLKWSFVFWIGTVAAIAAMAGLLH